jgi:Flp pilus assembly protein TadG
MTVRQPFWRSQDGASAAEFALVLPLFLILLLGIIDAGRLAWDYNRAEKASQVGARAAIVTNVLSSGLQEEDYAGKSYGGAALAPGDRIPAEALGEVKCTSAGCTCDTSKGNCPSTVGTFDSATFTNTLVARMHAIHPGITEDNVEVRYSGSGFGFAGSAASSGGGGGGGGAAEQMEISPLVTVTLKNVVFHPIMLFGLVDFNLPDISTTLTAEDASGSYSN